MDKFTLRRVMAISFLMLLSTLTFAQTARLQGRIVDNGGEGVPGATIQILGHQISTSSGANGEYSLGNITAGSHRVVVNMMGYETAEQNVTLRAGDNTLNFTLETTSSSLDEVVVIGYGTQRRGELTGAMTTVGEKDFQKGNITSPEQLIMGKAAGVQITPGGGQPGSGSTIRIRGGASLNASNDPLIVVDGVPLSNSSISGVANPLVLINPNDIESFTILKDANATAIYGSRASNGVILITTKKGKSGKPTFNFSSQNSLATLARKTDVLTADEVRAYVNEHGTDELKALLGTANTDWQDEIYQNAFSTDNNLSVAGAYKWLPYRVSVGYLNQDGVLKRDNLKRTSGSIALNPTFFDNHLKVNLNLKGTLTKSQFANQDAIGAAVQMDPTQPVYADGDQSTLPYGGYFEWLRPDGQLNPNAPRNPVALLYQKEDQGNTKRSFGNLELDYSFHFLPELRANLNAGYDVSTGSGDTYVPDYAAQNIGTNGYYKEYKTDISNKVLEFYLNYTKDIASIKSNINATAGYGYYANRSKVYNYSTYQGDKTTEVSTPVFPYDIPENRLLSYYGRLIYTYDSKYILSGTVRTDGSSRFAKDNRWGVFPSLAFTWRINDENFLKDNTVLSDLKLRTSYGVTGQQEGIANYSYLANYSISSNESMYQFGDTFYYMNAPVAYDSQIRWETTTTYNAGLDFGFLNNRITGSLDVYKRKTEDLLSTIPIPIGSNFSNTLLTNVGNMESNGIEIAINTKPIVKEKLSWDVGFNLTYNNAKVTNLTATYDPSYMVSASGITGSTGNYIAYHTLNLAPYSFYVYQQVYDENGKPLDGVYADRNGDGSITPDDRYFYHSPQAKVTMGFSTELNYDRWTLGTVLRSSLGNYVYNNVASNMGTEANLLDVNSQVVNNAVRDFQTTGFINRQYQSDYYIQNASFLKMDNINLSYHVGRIWKNGGDLTLSGIVQNVFLITKYKGIDPEISGGVDYNLYPRPRTFVIGLNLGF